MPAKKCIYAMYQGEEMIASGTAEELAAFRGVTVKTIYQYAKPWYIKRSKGPNHVVVISLGTAEELGEHATMKQNVYAMYKGGEHIATGTVNELAELRGVKPNAIYMLASESYQRGKKGNQTMVVKVGVTTEMGNY